MRRRISLDTVFTMVSILLVIVVLARLLLRDTHMRTRVWYYLAQYSQQMAYQFGMLGLEFEKAYYIALERTKL